MPCTRRLSCPRIIFKSFFFCVFLLICLCFYVLYSFLASSVSVPSLSTSHATLSPQVTTFMPGFQLSPLGLLFPHLYLQSFLWALDLHSRLSTWHLKRATNSANPKLCSRYFFSNLDFLSISVNDPGIWAFSLHCPVLHPPYPSKCVCRGPHRLHLLNSLPSSLFPHSHFSSLGCLHLLPGFLH